MIRDFIARRILLPNQWRRDVGRYVDPFAPMTQAQIVAARPWPDVTSRFRLRYRSDHSEVPLGRADETYRPGPVRSIAGVVVLERIADSPDDAPTYIKTAKIDAYFRCGSGMTAIRNGLPAGLLTDGWELWLDNKRGGALFPYLAGEGRMFLWVQGKGRITGLDCGWEAKPDGTYALVPRWSPLGVSAGNFSWSYPWVSGHSAWEIPGTHFRIEVEYRVE